MEVDHESQPAAVATPHKSTAPAGICTRPGLLAYKSRGCRGARAAGGGEAGGRGAGVRDGTTYRRRRGRRSSGSDDSGG